MSVDLATLAKLAVFERCTNDEAARALYRIVMENDTPEKHLLPPNKVDTPPDLPEAWKKFEAFVGDWQEMEPLFDGATDLRPAVFLSRDVMAPAVPRSGLTATGQEALTALLKVSSVTSPAAQRIVSTLPASDRPMVMSHLIDAMRQADWSKAVQGVHGALVLAKDNGALTQQLKAFVSSLPTKGMEAGIRYLLRNAGFLEAT